MKFRIYKMMKLQIEKQRTKLEKVRKLFLNTKELSLE